MKWGEMQSEMAAFNYLLLMILILNYVARNYQ